MRFRNRSSSHITFVTFMLFMLAAAFRRCFNGPPSTFSLPYSELFDLYFYSSGSKIKTRISVAKKKKEITDYQTSFIRCMSLRIYCGNALALLHHCWWHYFCPRVLTRQVLSVVHVIKWNALVEVAWTSRIWLGRKNALLRKGPITLSHLVNRNALGRPVTFLSFWVRVP